MSGGVGFQFFISCFATCGFCIIFQVHLRKIPIVMIIGGCGWITYMMSMSYHDSAVAASFLGACTVGLLSDLASRFFKDASTVFVIPGIICLVPGAGIYYTLLALVQQDTAAFGDYAFTTLLTAGAIGTGLLVTGSIMQVIRAVKTKLLK